MPRKRIALIQQTKNRERKFIKQWSRSYAATLQEYRIVNAGLDIDTQ